MITVYGIKNCDTCRKALKWLDAEGIEHKFHDFRKDGLDQSTVSGWIDEIGIDTAALLTENPTLMKRPIFDLGTKRLIGFKADAQEALKATNQS